MVDLIRADLRGDQAITSLIERTRKLPDMNSKTMLRWGSILAKDMRNSAVQAGIKNFTGELLKGKGIEWRQRPKGKIGILFIRKYGVDLDSMKPHYVAFKPSRNKFIKWGLRARSSTIRAKARRGAAGINHGRSIYVRPHPFIDRGWKRARSKLSPMINKDLAIITGG